MSYGFKEENAIAGCVQTEINNEITNNLKVLNNILIYITSSSEDVYRKIFIKVFI